MSQAISLEHADLLSRVDLFASLDRVTLAKLAAHLESVTVARGAAVFQQGDTGDAFYLVASGLLGVYVSHLGESAEKRVNTLGPGAPFGEMALLTGDRRSATIRADDDAEVLRLERGRFLKLVEQEPRVALAIAATLSQRLRAADAQRLGAQVAVPAPSRQTAAARAEESLGSGAGADQHRRPGPRALALLGAALIMVTVWVTPAPPGLAPAGWRALGTLVAAVPLLALDVVPEGVLALMLALVWVVGGVAPAEVALGGFASASWVLLVSVLGIGAAFASSGLLYRLALWIVAHSRGGFAGQALAVSLAGVVVGPAVPNATGRVTLIAPALTELVEALGYPPGSRPAAGLAMAGLIGFGQMASVFLTSSTTAVLVFAVLPPDTQRDLDWVLWAARAAPPNVLLFVGLILAIIWYYRPRQAEQRNAAARPDALALQRVLLGRPSREERIALAVSAGLLLGFATQPLHGAHPGWVAALAFAVLAVTGVVTAETLRAINWSFVLLFGMLASLSSVFTSTHVDRWVATLVDDAVGGLARTPILLVFMLTLLCFGVSLVLRWQAAAPLITIALAPGAAAAGISPLVIGLVAVIACNGFFVPYQSTTYLALYHGTGGKLFTHRQARWAAVAYGVATLLALCGSVPAWRAMGLL